MGGYLGELVDGSVEFSMYFKTIMRFFFKSQMSSNPYFHLHHPAITIREKLHHNATSGGVAARDIAVAERAPSRSRGG